MIAATPGRMLILWLATAWLASYSSQAAEPLRIESSLEAMGSTYTIVAYGTDRLRLEAAVEESFDEVRRLDALLSNYRERSEWSKVNREAGERPVRVSQELFELLDACVEYSRRTEGAFDITVGPLVRVWGFYKGSGRLPHRAEIRGAMAKVGYQKVQLDRDGRSVRFTRAGVELDPGGIGKGYAVDRVVDVLKKNGIETALVTAGGSSMYGLGAPPGEAAWKVKIRHPKNPNVTVGDVKLRNLSMSTSGTSEKFFVAGGRVYSHIFDPRTGYPAQGMLSVSVTAPRTIDSEAWTKPLFIHGRKWAEKNKPKEFEAFFCEDKPEIACAWLQ